MYNTSQSEAKFDQAIKTLAGGVASSLRVTQKPTPIYIESGKGAELRDVDGNEYIDYMLAYGPLILGHAPEGLTEAITKAMEKGYSYGLQHDGEIDLAEKLVEILPCAEKVSLSGSGTEAVMLALRLARAHTGRQKVVRFHGHYHGWSDSIFTSFPGAGLKDEANEESEAAVLPGTGGQSTHSLEDVILLPWNNEEELEKTLREHGSEIAAVISEPVMCNSGCLRPNPGYLEKMRELTKEQGIILILDEVITGFRLGLGGAHGRFGIDPDLVTIGKAMGGGIAISAVAGKAEIMKWVDDSKVTHLGTLNGNRVSTAAALATIGELEKDNGAAFVKMESLFEKLASGIREQFEKHQVPGVVNQIGPVMQVIFTDAKEVQDFDTFNERDAAKYTKFAEEMLKEGVMLRMNGLWYISAAHEEEHIEKTLQAIDRVLPRL